MSQRETQVRQDESPDEAAVQILLWAVRGNYDHPSGVWCQGCLVEFDGQAILDDIREKGWELKPR